MKHGPKFTLLTLAKVILILCLDDENGLVNSL
jgi:hypothetical protein